MPLPTATGVTPLTGAGLPVDPPGATRFRLASPTTGVVLAVLTLAMAAACLVLGSLTGDPQDDLASNALGVGAALSFSAVGFVVARRQPHNPIAWILIASAPLVIISQLASTYSIFDYQLHQGTLPLGWVAVSLAGLWVPWIMLLGLPILLFPAGIVPSPRWRWSLWVYLVLGGLSTVGILADGVYVALGRHVDILLDGSPKTSDQPGLATLGGDVLAVCALLGAVLWVAWIGRLVVSYRRAKGDRRQQLKWLSGGAAITLIVFVVSFFLPSGQLVDDVVLPFGIAALPIGMGVGILKYRLYDIDRLISRTLSYAIVTGLLIGVYVGLVTLATRVLPFSTPLGVAASTLAAAALFNPLRRRVQRLVDRRFNRARYDAEATVAAFAQRVRDDVDLDVVSSEFVRAVQYSVEPAHVSLWLRQPGG